MLRQIIFVIIVSILMVSCSNSIPTQTTETPTNLPTTTSTPTSTPSPTSSLTPTLTPLPTPIGGASGKLIFTYYKNFCPQENEVCGYEKAFPDLKGESNIFVSNWDGTELTPVTKDGFDGYTFIEAISPDGRKLLVLSYSSNGANLYLVDLDSSEIKPQEIAVNIFPRAYGFGNARAAWIDNSSIVYIGLYGGDIALWRINLDGTGRLRLSKNIEPWGIFSVNPQTGVIWRGDTFDSIQISSLDGKSESTVKVKTLGPFATNHYSPDGKWIFWQLIHATAENPDDPTQALYAGSLGQVENPKLVADLPNRYWTIRFSSDRTKAVFLPTTGSNASNPGLSDHFRKLPIYILSLKSLELKELPIPDYDRLDIYLDPAQSSTALSPDGKLIVITSSDSKGSQTIQILNLETFISSDEIMSHISAKAITSIFWLP